MISIIHPVWRAIRLYDEASIEYLNRMFRQGWGLVPFDMDDIDWLAMDVPLETPKRVRFDDIHQQMAAGGIPTMRVVVLRHDKLKNMFQARISERDDSGYVQMDFRGVDKTQWAPIMTFGLDSGNSCTIFAHRNVVPRRAR